MAEETKAEQAEEIAVPEADTKGAEGTQIPSAEESEPKWTDEKVDAYVKARIDKQNSKHGAELADVTERAEKAERELAAVTLERDRQSVALKYGLPIEQVHGTDRDEMERNAESLKEYIGTLPIYPAHKGGDGGTKPKATREGIMAIKNPRERREAIAENIDLFQ